jgi:serine/threonine-protein kinase HipA
MARLMLQSMNLGEDAVLELLRRLTVNELLGNYDAHVKNFGIVYPDGRTPTLAPAYDIVAYAAYLSGRGHALPFSQGGKKQATLSPAVLREFCTETQIPEPVAASVVRQVVKAATQTWPGLIDASELLPQQKQRLLSHFDKVPAVQTYRKRARR